MIERITKNEEIMDNIIENVRIMEDALSSFESMKKDLDLVNKYYGSKNWFKDKEKYENNTLPKIKAGILSEDGVWDLNDNVKNVLAKMQEIISVFSIYKGDEE